MEGHLGGNSEPEHNETGFNGFVVGQVFGSGSWFDWGRTTFDLDAENGKSTPVLIGGRLSTPLGQLDFETAAT